MKRVHKFSYSTNPKIVAANELHAQYPDVKDGKLIHKFWKDAGDVIGTSVANWCNMLKGASYRAYILPEKALIDRFSYDVYKDHSTGAWKWYRNDLIVDLVNKHLPTIKQYIADGNEHIAAYAMLTGDAKSSKQLLGKSLWKQICNTSKTRNDMIWKCIHNISAYNHGADMMITLKAMLVFLHSVKSTLISRLGNDVMSKAFNLYNTAGVKNLVGKIAVHVGGPMKAINSNEVEDILNTLHDTATMRTNFNADWSVTRMLNEHAAAIRDQMEKDYPTTKFPLVDILTNSYDMDGFTAKLITSPRELATHAKEQHHCAAGYATRIAQGRYAIYMITDPDGKVSTLGIHNPVCTSSHDNDQHYYRYNKSIDDLNTNNFAAEIKADVKLIMQDNPEMLSVHTQRYDEGNNAPHQVWNLDLPINDVPF